MKVFPYNGTEVEGREVGIASASEPWTEVLLDNGAVLRLRLIVTGAYRLMDQNDAQGRPVYYVEHQVIIAPVLCDTKV